MASERKKAIRLKRFHGWMTVFWAVQIPPAMLWWQQSVPYLVFLSITTACLTSFSAWQATRAEVSGEDNTEEIKGVKCECCGHTK